MPPIELDGDRDPLSTLRADLASLQERGLRRVIRPVASAQDAEVQIEGRAAINFCSNNYLGLANHPALRKAAEAAMAREGFGAGASRLIGGDLEGHRSLEHAIARWKRTTAALLFNSGYQANVGLVSALVGPEDALFSDRLNHASIIDGARLSRGTVHVYPHGDVRALDRLLSETRRARRRVIVTESVFSMDGDQAPLADLADLALRHDALLMVDEAHAVGVLGEAGMGCSAQIAPRLGPRLIQMGTLGKAIGAFGAYVAGAAEVIDLCINLARSFVFTTALPPPVAAAAEAGIGLLGTEEGRRRQQRLHELAERLHRELVQLGLGSSSGAPSHIVPLIVGDAAQTMDLSRQLLDRGLYVQGIRPPTVPQGTARLRLSLMANHSDAHLDALIEALSELRAAFRP